jgi:endonuclease YncB( thermonuclease family)
MTSLTKTMNIDDAIHHDLPRFSLNGQTFQGKVVSVYDGDTCDFILYSPDEGVRRFIIRMLSYNSPEIRVSRLLDPEERSKLQKSAKEAKAMLGSLLGLDLKVEERPTFTVKCGVFDKYGRVLANVYTLDDVCINDLMLSNGYGVPFMQSDSSKV